MTRHVCRYSLKGRYINFSGDRSVERNKKSKKNVCERRERREDVTTARRARRDESRAGEVLARRPGRALL
jgi:hypothetical protein